MYRVRDFIETHDGLVFSVISNLHPPDGVLSHLRFLRDSEGLKKVASTKEGYQYLSRKRPDYLRFCSELDRELPVVPLDSISRHYQPDVALAGIMREGNDPEVSAIVTALMSRSGKSLEGMGITGSYLLGAQTPSSDIDLVIYGLDDYVETKRAFLECVEEGIFSLPDEGDWAAIYQKRAIDPTVYSQEEFVWHESRKHSRGIFGRRRFDLLSCRKNEEIEGAFDDYSFKRLGTVEVRCTVADSELSHDYPARYILSDCEVNGHVVREVVSYTHTFVEQARKWETIICRGILERATGLENYHRILVGSSREAPGEFIKVQGTVWGTEVR